MGFGYCDIEFCVSVLGFVLWSFGLWNLDFGISSYRFLICDLQFGVWVLNFGFWDFGFEFFGFSIWSLDFFP